ncbi:MAG: hypothetical protein U5K74_10680 [Gemmatimonadaceae bacterium]|nr:hypothetical protein [Gemmatimonadaceae bacterium]
MGRIDWTALKPSVERRHLKVFEFSPSPLTAEEVKGGVDHLKAVWGKDSAAHPAADDLDPVSETDKILQTSGRLIVCALLLLWIFHSIFVDEARRTRHGAGLRSGRLPRIEQWRQGWSIGPGEIWRESWRRSTPGLFAASVLVMGVTFVLGLGPVAAGVAQVQELHLPWGRAMEDLLCGPLLQFVPARVDWAAT